MGYMGLESSSESDRAADLMNRVLDGIAEHLHEGLQEAGNSYNTDGCVNVAFVFDELLPQGHHEIYISCPRLREVARQCIAKLDALISEAQTIEWDNEDNRYYHLTHYRRLKESVERFVSG